MEAASFLRGSDPGDSPEAYALRKCKAQLEDMCNLLDFGANLQRVRVGDIDKWERDLRAILKEIKRLRSVNYIDSLLDSSDGVQKYITNALDHLYVAADILRKQGSNTVREREKFYEKLRGCSHCLSKSLEYFLV